MATATRQVEQIVRKVMSEEMDETVNAIQEISTLLTEQVIPRLSGEPDEASDVDDEEDLEEPGSGRRPMAMSAFNGRGKSTPGRGRPNGHDDSDESEGVETPEREVPEEVTTAFEELYRTLSPEQASAFVELFTAIQDELDNEGEGAEADEGEGAEAIGRG